MPTRRPGKPRPPCRPSDLTVALRAKESTEWRRAMRAAVNLLSGKDEEPLSRVRLKHGSTTAGSHLADDQRVPGAPGDTLARQGGAAADWMMRTSTVDISERRVGSRSSTLFCSTQPSFTVILSWRPVADLRASDVVRPEPMVKGARARHEDQARDQQRVRKIRVGTDRRTHEHRAGDLPGSKGRGDARHEASGVRPPHGSCLLHAGERDHHEGAADQESGDHDAANSRPRDWKRNAERHDEVTQDPQTAVADAPRPHGRNQRGDRGGGSEERPGPAED